MLVRLILLFNFVQKNYYGALMVLKQMEEADVKPDSETFSYLISNCKCENDIIKVCLLLHFLYILLFKMSKMLLLFPRNYWMLDKEMFAVCVTVCIIVNHFHHLHRLFPCIISIHLSSKVQINMTSMLAKCWIFYGDKSLPSYNFYIVCQKIWRYLYHLLACVHWKFMIFPIPLWICTEFFTKRHATLYFPFMPDIKEA